MRLFTLMFALAIVASGQTYTLKSGSKIFIEPMEQSLDSYLKAEFVKQKVKLAVVGSLEEADYVMLGSTTEREKRRWHEGWLTAEQDRTSGSVTVVDKTTKALVWAGEAGDRSVWWGAMARGGHRKVASRIVKSLKKAVKN